MADTLRRSSKKVSTTLNWSIRIDQTLYARSLTIQFLNPSVPGAASLTVRYEKKRALPNSRPVSSKKASPLRLGPRILVRPECGRACAIGRCQKSPSQSSANRAMDVAGPSMVRPRAFEQCTGRSGPSSSIGPDTSGRWIRLRIEDARRA